MLETLCWRGCLGLSFPPLCFFLCSFETPFSSLLAKISHTFGGRFSRIHLFFSSLPTSLYLIFRFHLTTTPLPPQARFLFFLPPGYTSCPLFVESVPFPSSYPTKSIPLGMMLPFLPKFFFPFFYSLFNQDPHYSVFSFNPLPPYRPKLGPRTRPVIHTISSTTHLRRV